MTKFETYEQLYRYLKSHTDLCMTRRYLDTKIKEEVAWYKKENKPTGTKEEKKEIELEYKNKAQEDYLEEINEFLLKSEPLTSMSIMGYRRKPHSWAIADAIKEYELCKVQLQH